MIELIKNINNIKDEEIDVEVTRVKALIINDKNEILLGHSFCEYQFPGGHVEDHEDLNFALQRELKEETGLFYDTLNLEPIAKAIIYHKDTVNSKIVIYYYELKDNRIPNLSDTNYTEEELDGNFSLRYIPLDIVCDVLIRNIEEVGDPQGISGEMLELFAHYLPNRV